MVSIDDSSTEVPFTLNAEAKVAEDEADEQGANRLATGWDPEKVARMAEIVSELAGEWSDRTIAVKILRGLCELTERHPERLEPGRDSEHWGFLALEIGEALDRLDIGSTQLLGSNPELAAEYAQKRMKDHWPKLEAVWERVWPTIADRLSARKMSLRPIPFRQKGGGAGKNTRFGFRPLQDESAQDQQAPIIDWQSIPTLRYQRADISGSQLIRWISERGLYLGGWTGKIYVGVVGPLFFGGLFLLWLSFVAMANASTSLDFLQIGLSLMVILAFGYLIFGWQVRLVANRVTLAPMLLQPLSSKHGDYLLELRSNADRGKNSLYLVRYVADCHICGADGHEKVRIESGRREFFGRLVGRCDRSPNEHVFSFDHVTRQGRFLR